MRATDTTDPRTYEHVRIHTSQMHGGREHNVAERFRMHLIGMYSNTVGPEWSSGGRSEGDCVHHINLNLTGRRRVIFRGKTYDLNPGEAWYLPANTPVERYCEEICEIVYFKFFCECLPGVDPLLDWETREPRRMRKIDVNEWRTWLESDKPIGIASILGLRGRLMWWMVQAIPELDAAISQHLAKHSRFSKVLHHIESHLGADLRLADLAQVHGTGTAAFSAAFVRSTGISPKEYLNRRLNQEAIRWVLTSGLKMKEIAENLRFNDEYYFSRFFQKQNGISPLRYRSLLSGTQVGSRNSD
ncbi:MAG: AraC family transcriptional regulator [Akkermansiaceae bacterium]|jgi:AraC-like DNA-binding protein|nr:AraC family transcriptional regulator [Akkermansiaceae bacterium]